jgi:hypothetical protein
MPLPIDERPVAEEKMATRIARSARGGQLDPDGSPHLDHVLVAAHLRAREELAKLPP